MVDDDRVPDVPHVDGERVRDEEVLNDLLDREHQQQDLRLRPPGRSVTVDARTIRCCGTRLVSSSILDNSR